MQLPEIEQLVTLDYSALTTGVRPQSVIKPARRMRSYDRRHVDKREARAKTRYMRLNKKYQQLQVSYQQLKKECKQQQAQIKCLKAQLAKTRASLSQKMALNRKNLKRIGTLKYTAKNKAHKISQQAADQLRQTQQDLIAEKHTVKYMTEKMQELDEEYCELEEKYKDAKSKVEEFLEGHKYIPKTKEGQKFTNDIRTLYYRLLAEQIPPRKIEKSIKIVLETMCPNIDAEKLKLPKTSLASKMRSCELPTVSKAHQASILSQTENYHVNSDGTTYNQKKVQGFLINGLTLGVADVSDGTAQAAIDSLDWQFKIIREVGKDLGIEGADTIGWRLIHSIMSDQASTQKAFNRLVKDRADLETQERGLLETNERGRSILETFCGMHLGVNLRTAEVHNL